MSNFSSCYKQLLLSDASHSWIALHRCVEAFARTSGTSYNSIFCRYEEKFNFDRRKPDTWPNHDEIKLIGSELKKERDEYINNLHILIEKRKEEKRKGIRNLKDEVLLSICNKQLNYSHEKMPPWGWKKRRLD